MDSGGILWIRDFEGLPRGSKGLWEIRFGLPDTDATIISLAYRAVGLATWLLSWLVGIPPPAERLEQKKNEVIMQKY